MTSPISFFFACVARLCGTSLRREEGQTMAEYAIMLGLIALLVVAVVLVLSGNISDFFTSAGSKI